MACKELVLDSSALVSVLLREKDYSKIEEIIAAAERVLMSATSRLEVCMVLSGTTGFNEEHMVQTQQRFKIRFVPVSVQHAITGFEAFQKYGKGNHKASLNFGDCHAYATAKLAGLPLLYVGNDFSHTDLETVVL